MTTKEQKYFLEERAREYGLILEQVEKRFEALKNHPPDAALVRNLLDDAILLHSIAAQHFILRATETPDTPPDHHCLMDRTHYLDTRKKKHLYLAVESDVKAKVGEKILLEEFSVGEDMPGSAIAKTGNSTLFEITEVGDNPTPLMNNDGGMLYYIKLKYISGTVAKKK